MRRAGLSRAREMISKVSGEGSANPDAFGLVVTITWARTGR